MNGCRIEKVMRETDEEMYTFSFNALKHRERERKWKGK
jgi:hypothetical protein